MNYGPPLVSYGRMDQEHAERQARNPSFMKRHGGKVLLGGAALTAGLHHLGQRFDDNTSLLSARNNSILKGLGVVKRSLDSPARKRAHTAVAESLVAAANRHVQDEISANKWADRFGAVRKLGHPFTEVKRGMKNMVEGYRRSKPNKITILKGS